MNVRAGDRLRLLTCARHALIVRSHSSVLCDPHDHASAPDPALVALVAQGVPGWLPTDNALVDLVEVAGKGSGGSEGVPQGELC